jgi:S-layer homology domain
MRIFWRRLALVPIAVLSLLAGGAVARMQDVCGPFTDVTPSLCPYVLEMYYLGITAGTSSTTFSPDNVVTRGQAAVFVSKSINQSIARSSRRAALGQWWTTTPHWDIGLGVTDDALGPVACDGSDVWVGSSSGMRRVRGSDGRTVEVWPGVYGGQVLAAMGRIFVATGDPGQLYMIDPSQPPGSAVLVADGLGGDPQSIAFDGQRIWTGNRVGHSVSIVQPGAATPWSVTNVTQGFDSPMGVVYDGTNMWVSDAPVGKIHRLDSSGAILNSYLVGDGVGVPLYDGANLWIPTCCGISVMRPADGTSVGGVPAPANGTPVRLAFDGRRILLVSANTDLLSLWDAASLTPIATVSTGLPTGIQGLPQGACSDGVNFWLTIGSGLVPAGKLLRF